MKSRKKSGNWCSCRVQPHLKHHDESMTLSGTISYVFCPPKPQRTVCGCKEASPMIQEIDVICEKLRDFINSE